jgi:hypothetical protein
MNSLSILSIVIIGILVAMLPTFMVEDQRHNLAFAQTDIPSNKPGVMVCKDVTGLGQSEGAEAKIGSTERFRINVGWERSFGPSVPAVVNSFLLKDGQCKISTLSRSMTGFPVWDFKVTEEPKGDFNTEYAGECQAEDIESNVAQLFTCTVTNIPKVSCEECFTHFLSENKIQELLDLIIEARLEELCVTLEEGGYTEARLRDLLDGIGINDATVDSIIVCLENAGIEFLI